MGKCMVVKIGGGNWLNVNWLVKWLEKWVGVGELVS